MCLFYRLKLMGMTCTRRYNTCPGPNYYIPATGAQVPKVGQQNVDVGNIMPCVDILRKVELNLDVTPIN